MKFLVIFLLIALSPVLTSGKPPPNKINSSPSGPSSSQHPSSPPAHPTQPEQPRNPLPPFPLTNPSPVYPSPNPLPLLPVTNYQAAEDSNLSPLALFPVTDYQSSDHPNPNLPTLNPETYYLSPDSPNVNPNPPFPSTRFQLPYAPRRSSPFPPFRIPWYGRYEFVAIEAVAPHGPLPYEFEVMDHLRLYVLSYFFASGLSHTSSWCQCPNFTTSIHIQCFLNQLAFSFFLLANTVFPRTHPPLAFMLHRLSVLLMIISGYLASMPMYPPYVAIIMFVVVVIVYIMNRMIRRG